MKITLAGVVAWARQATTGVGASTVVTALAGGATHTISWPEAALGVGAGVLMIVHPEISKERAVAVVQTVAPAAETGIKDVARQIANKHIEGVTDAKDLLTFVSALEKAFPAAPGPQPAPAPQPAPSPQAPIAAAAAAAAAA
jgi:hypothetical protein